MASAYNKKLKELADTSAIKQSIVPILICDENFYVCAKSVGIERTDCRIVLKTSVADRFSEDDRTRLSDPDTCAFSTTFGCGRNRIAIIVVKGNISGEPYYAVVFEQSMMLCPTSEPWYIGSAYCAIADSVNKLLSTPNGASSTLKHRCLQLSRLCSIIAARSGKGFAFSPAMTELSELTELLMSSCKEAIPLVGVTTRLTIEPNLVMNTTAPPKLLYMLLASLTISAIALSSSGELEIVCGTDGCPADTAEVAVNVCTAPELMSKIVCFDDLIEAVTPFRLELAAFKDIAADENIELGCRTECGKLTIFCRVPTVITYTASFHSPAAIGDSILRDLLYDMYAFLREVG